MLTPVINPELLARLQPVKNVPLPKVRQLYRALYGSIADGHLHQGYRLPSSRELAQQLGIARNTVISVYQQLSDEGMLQSDGRRGTVVCALVATLSPSKTAPWSISARGRQPQSNNSHCLAFAPGEPDAALFPQHLWKQALTRAARLAPTELAYRPRPLLALQKAISRYLLTYRSLRVDPVQVVVTASTRQSLLLSAVLFADAGDHAWVESPGYLGAVDAFRSQGLVLHACPVDRDGILPLTSPVAPKLIYVTPCFQYPTGVALSAARREQLISYSAESGAVLFEDDYDSEFRDASQPRPALAASAENARVLHAGTFSKLMFPAVRVAWLVVPHVHIDDAQRCLRAIGGGHNSVAQAAVAELLDNGSIARHLQRTRSVYAQRRQRLLDALEQSAHINPSDDSHGSLSLIVELNQSVDRVKLEMSLVEQGLGAVSLERLHWQRPLAQRCRAVVVGLGNVDSLSIPAAVKRFDKAVLQSLN